MDVMWMGTVVVAALTGALLGAAGAWRVFSVRAVARHAHLVTVAREQLAAGTQSVRATNVRLQAELDKERSLSHQRVIASTAEQRASVARLEGQLRYAYAEIDRLNGAIKGASVAGAVPDDASGFALTRPHEH